MTTETMNNISILYILGAAQGFFLALALFNSKIDSHKANRYLGCLILVFAAALLDYFADARLITEQHPWIRTLLWPKEFLYGTLLYFYVRELTLPNTYYFEGVQCWHFAPALIHILVTWPLLFFPPEVQYQVLSSEQTSNDWLNLWALVLGDIELVVTIAQISIYQVMSVVLIFQHQKRVAATLSFTDQVNLSWLRNMLIGYVSVYVIWLFEELFSDALHQPLLFDILLALSMVVLIYGIGYLGLRQPLVFKSQALRDAVEASESANPSSTSTTVPELTSTAREPRYQKSALSDELAKQIIDQCGALMARNKLYQEAQLSLPMLAQQLGVSVHHLSQSINLVCQQNFFDFVNQYRVQEAKRILIERPSTAVLTVGLDAGFNSKTAFYKAFKKETGQTPGQYRVAHK